MAEKVISPYARALIIQLCESNKLCLLFGDIIFSIIKRRVQFLRGDNMLSRVTFTILSSNDVDAYFKKAVIFQFTEIVFLLFEWNQIG